ncbi:MAG: DUF1552 domain-containing protein [Myxococcales bacterium]|nr:DUF1552 domain-containing protein [Myxococcales bacterium]
MRHRVQLRVRAEHRVVRAHEPVAQADQPHRGVRSAVRRLRSGRLRGRGHAAQGLPDQRARWRARGCDVPAHQARAHGSIQARRVPERGPRAGDPDRASDEGLQARRAAARPLEFADRSRAMIDLIAIAFECDLTRVVTFMLGNAGSGNTHPQIGIAESHHELSHHMGNTTNLAKLTQINTWEIGELAYRSAS